MARIPMSDEGRRRMARRQQQLIRWGKIGVIAVWALAGVLLAVQL